MTERQECKYCGSTYESGEKLTEHLAEGHDRSERSRIDERRVEKFRKNNAHHRVRPDGVGISRRAFVAATAIGVGGIATKFGGTVVGSSSTQISNWDELDEIRTDLDGDYVLVDDLHEDSPEYEGTGDDWNPIETFTGEFDGNGHTISDLTIERGNESSVGLFGEADDSAVIEDVHLRDAAVTGESEVGTLVGFTESNGEVEIIDCSATGEVTATTTSSDAHAGGLVGRSYWLLENCVAAVDVSAEERYVGGLLGRLSGSEAAVRNSAALGTVESTDDAVGGLVGLTTISTGQVIEESYANVDIEAEGRRIGGLVGGVLSNTSIEHVYVAGLVDTTGVDVGAIIGRQSDTNTILRNAYWDTETTGQDEAVGSPSNEDTVVGLPTDDMQGVSPLPEADGGDDTMSGFDFDENWHAVEAGDRFSARAAEDGYPILRATDAELQLSEQGILLAGGPVSIDGDNVTISNSTITGGDDDE